MKQLIEKAKEKGFESEFFNIEDEADLDYLINRSNEMEEYLFLCELKKWLMDKHKIYVVNPNWNGRLWYFEIEDFAEKNDKSYLKKLCSKPPFEFNSETEALKEGLINALTLI